MHRVSLNLDRETAQLLRELRADLAHYQETVVIQNKAYQELLAERDRLRAALVASKAYFADLRYGFHKDGNEAGVKYCDGCIEAIREAQANAERAELRARVERLEGALEKIGREFCLCGKRGSDDVPCVTCRARAALGADSSNGISWPTGAVKRGEVEGTIHLSGPRVPLETLEIRGSLEKDVLAKALMSILWVGSAGTAARELFYRLGHYDLKGLSVRGNPEWDLSTPRRTVGGQLIMKEV